ncbi:LrgB family protein [Helcococcus kunzii]|uniref:TIGR00659 family protein n=1 Tax=Helcococcus kunzii ATCC 51366 TaxID=883114 RepID=H3NLL6_9FIRM|nr:LrgB family protein [Helcococcus kunzii]EHR35781.1 TIGR00659 family protein [Helcococcus kunzii ATCC 51366]QZO76614.1 LrgB family protein [Helcococcus kunzii]
MIDSIVKSPVFGIVITLVMYIIALWINKKTKIAALNPLLVSTIFVIIFLLITKIKYEDYNIGGQYITFLIAPSTVALVVNLYKNIDLLKKNLIPIFVGIFAGVITSVLSVFALSKLLGVNKEMLSSLIPKSLTTAIGVAISQEFGGIEVITVFAIIITGIVGAVISPFVFKIFNIKTRVAKGIGLGTAAHAIGTSKAIEMGEVEGGMSGLSIALAGFISVILIPLFMGMI